MRRQGVFLSVLLVMTLCACGGAQPSPAPAHGQRLTASDGSFTMTVPKGWSAHESQAQDPIVLVAPGTNKVNQLLVSEFEGKDEAENNAIFAVTGLLDGGTECKRTKPASNLVFDCAGNYQGMPYRKLFFPIEHGNNSYLVLVQTQGETLSDAGKVASPIVASIEFS